MCWNVSWPASVDSLAKTWLSLSLKLYPSHCGMSLHQVPMFYFTVNTDRIGCSKNVKTEWIRCTKTVKTEWIGCTKTIKTEWIRCTKTVKTEWIRCTRPSPAVSRLSCSTVAQTSCTDQTNQNPHRSTDPKHLNSRTETIPVTLPCQKSLKQSFSFFFLLLLFSPFSLLLSCA